MPLLLPVQIQLKGPAPVTVGIFAVSMQRLLAGAVATAVPFALPQAPFIGVSRGAEQLAGIPPLMPVQVQVKGPLPVTVGGVSEILQRFVVGADATGALFALPQAPSSISEAEQLLSWPLLVPVQVQLKGPVPVTVGIFPVVVQRFMTGTAGNAEPFALPQEPAIGDWSVPVPLPLPQPPRRTASNDMKIALSSTLDPILFANDINMNRSRSLVVLNKRRMKNFFIVAATVS